MKFSLQNLIARFKTAGLAGNALHRLFSLTRPDHTPSPLHQHTTAPSAGRTLKKLPAHHLFPSLLLILQSAYPIARLGANVYYSNVSVEHHTALETTLLEQGAHTLAQTLAQTREILLKNTNGTIPRYEAERMAGKLCLHYIGIRTLLIWFILLDCLKSPKWPI
jgi:hypothetical protein